MSFGYASPKEQRLGVYVLQDEREQFSSDEPIRDWEIPLGTSFSGWMRNDNEARELKSETEAICGN